MLVKFISCEPDRLNAINVQISGNSVSDSFQILFEGETICSIS